MAEVPLWPPPAPHKASYARTNASSPQGSEPRYLFPYPTRLVPVPYITPLPFKVILHELLTRAREGRVIPMNLPVLLDMEASSGEMDIDSSPEQSGSRSSLQLREAQVPITSDGLLLYVGEASYESGESPLSVWVPRTAHSGPEVKAGDEAETAREDRAGSGLGESPLNRFERSGFSYA